MDCGLGIKHRLGIKSRQQTLYNLIWGWPDDAKRRKKRGWPKSSIEFITCDFHNPLSSKSQMLDRPTVRSLEQSVRVLEEIVKVFRQIVQMFRQTVKAFGQNITALEKLLIIH